MSGRRIAGGDARLVCPRFVRTTCHAPSGLLTGLPAVGGAGEHGSSTTRPVGPVLVPGAVGRVGGNSPGHHLGHGGPAAPPGVTQPTLGMTARMTDHQVGRRTLEPFSEDFDTADDAGADLAAEHDQTSFADEVGGGPEHADEPESPTGHAGMDE